MKKTNQFPQKRLEDSQYVAQVQKIFDEEGLSALASEVEFIKQERELTAMAFFHLCVTKLSLTGLHLTLSDMQTYLAELGVKIHQESLRTRFTESALNFLKRCLQEVLSIRLFPNLTTKYSDVFTGIYLEDSTKYNLPTAMQDYFPGCGGQAGASKAGVRINLYYDILGTGLGFKVNQAKGPDDSENNYEAGSLVLRDKGYYKIKHFEALIEKKAYFISRQSINYNIYLDQLKENRFDLSRYLAKMQEGEIRRIQVFIGEKTMFKTDMIIEKIPDQVAAEKRRKLRANAKKKGKNISAKSLAWAGANVLITNIPVDKISNQEILLLYRVRWQIEIVFKSWKSYMHIDYVKNMPPMRFLCLLYGRLIWITLQFKFFQLIRYLFPKNTKPLSWLKVMKRAWIKREELFRTIRKNKRYTWIRYFREIAIATNQNDRIEKNINEIYKIILPV